MSLTEIIEIIKEIARALAIIISGSTVLFRVFLKIAKTTETKKDDDILKRAIKMLTRALEFLSLNVDVD